MAIGEALLTVEEFADLPDDGRCLELVRGRIVEVSRPDKRHGQICFQAAFLLGMYVRANGLGHILMNDSGIITGRDPDTLRGADVAFYRFEKLPRGRLSRGYPTVPPDLVIEVRSPNDRWREIQEKVAEYIKIGVPVVCVLDENTQSAYLFHQDKPPVVLGEEDELTLPEILGDFRVIVGQFYEE